MIIEIPGRPVAKQRARTVNGHTYTPPKTRAFEELVAVMTRAQRRGVTLTGDVGLTILIEYKTRPRADIDNYAKAIMDGIVKGGAIEDDRQVTRLVVDYAAGEEWVTYVKVDERTD